MTTAIPSTGLEIHLAKRPHGWPANDDFTIVDAPVPTPATARSWCATW